MDSSPWGVRAVKEVPTLGDHVTLVTKQLTERSPWCARTCLSRVIMVAGAKRAHHPKGQRSRGQTISRRRFFSASGTDREETRKGEADLLMYFSNPRRTGCGQCKPSNQHSQM